MNRAEYITFTINRLNEQDAISQRESVRVLLDLACMQNSGRPAADIDESAEMIRLYEEVSEKWGKL